MHSIIRTLKIIFSKLKNKWKPPYLDCKYDLKTCSKHFDKINIDSNGVNYTTNKDLQQLIQKYKEHLNVSITIDGCKEAHDSCRVFPNGQGSFDQVVAGVKQLKQDFNRIPENKMTFSAENVQYLKKSVQTLVELGYESTLASYDEFHQCTEEESENFYQALVETVDWLLENKPSFELACLTKKFVTGRQFSMCGSKGDMITIAPGGYIACCQTMTPSVLEGEIEPLGLLGDVHRGITNTALLDFMRNQTFMEPVNCVECPIKHGCDGCAATNLAKTGYLFLDWHNCGATVAEARAQQYLIKRIKELGMEDKIPYWDEIKENHYDPDYNYLLKTVFKKDTK